MTAAIVIAAIRLKEERSVITYYEEDQVEIIGIFKIEETKQDDTSFFWRFRNIFNRLRNKAQEKSCLY